VYEGKPGPTSCRKAIHTVNVISDDNRSRSKGSGRGGAGRVISTELRYVQGSQNIQQTITKLDWVVSQIRDDAFEKLYTHELIHDQLKTGTQNVNISAVVASQTQTVDPIVDNAPDSLTAMRGPQSHCTIQVDWNRSNPSMCSNA
jgi:hypothetical protein